MQTAKILVVEFHIKAVHVDAFDLAIRENAQASLAGEPGCKRFDVCRDPSDPKVFFLYEIYEDESAVQAHLASPHFLHMNELTRAWVELKTLRRLDLPVS